MDPRANDNPCMESYGRDRAGGICTIVGPNWGTNLDNFKRIRMASKAVQRGDESGDMTDRTMGHTLRRYAHNRMRGSTPIELHQRVSPLDSNCGRNGVIGSRLSGDLNETWTGVEPGGQATLRRLADSFSPHSVVIRVARQLYCDVYTWGGDDQPQTWADHLLRDGLIDDVGCPTGHNSQAPLGKVS